LNWEVGFARKKLFFANQLNHFSMNQNNSTRAFATLVSVFFFWGFVAASNDILIPVFKDKLHLEQWQSQMISFVFYVAYTLGSLGYMLTSFLMKRDLLGSIGYGKGIALGLVISAIGSLMFIPAADTASFPMLLGGLIIVGLGFSLQQTAANPLAIALGTPQTGSQRLSLAGGVNNFGTTIGPLLVTFAIFGAMGSSSGAELDVSAVKVPYLVLGGLFLIFAAIFYRLKVNVEAPSEEAAVEGENSKSVLSYKQVWMGMIAIFLYVGVEVSTAGNLSEYLKSHLNIATRDAAPFISLFWASLMIGRWTGSAGSFNVSATTKKLLRLILPLAAFGVYLAVNTKAGYDVSQFYPYLGMIAILVGVDMLSQGNPAKQLLIYSLCGIGALVVGILSGGMTAAMAFVSVGLFCSTLWPCIFTLAITGLGSKMSKASNYLIMMIMGGGFVSVLQGKLASPDSLGILNSYWVGVVCFAYLAFYAVTMKAHFKKAGIEVGAPVGGH
jgi:FHS family L-fucose permease-like MFS transporter